MWPNFSPHPAKSPPFSREVFGSWGGFIFHFLIIIVRVVFLVFFYFFFFCQPRLPVTITSFTPNTVIQLLA